MDDEVIRGREAQRHIVDVAQEVSSRVRSTLGPLGFDQLMVDKMGEHLLTNDGATILKMQENRDPIAKMIVEVAKAQEERAFDGTTTCVILLAELLRLADTLIEKGIHPNHIARGYREGLKQAIECANNECEDLDRVEASIEAAKTALTGKIAGDYADKLVSMCSKAALSAKPDDVKILAMPGDTNNSDVVEGVVIMKEIAMGGMPTNVDGKILVINEDLAPPQANISLNDPAKIAEIAKVQTDYLHERLSHIKDLNVSAVFCQKTIDTRAQQYFRQEGISAFKQVRKSDIYRIAEVTGSNIVTDIATIGDDDLGEGTVKFVKAKPNPYTTIEGPKKGSVSILLYAQTEQAASEIMRALDDAVGVSWLVATNPRMVAGAGAIQNDMARHIKNAKPNLDSKAEAARTMFAEALMLIPRTLAESAGMDIMDTMHDLSSMPGAGVNALESTIEVMDVMEPLEVVVSAMNAAVENVIALLRTDAIIKAKSFQEVFSSEMGFD